MSAAFTPGPWEARSGSLHRQHWLIDAPGRRFIATIDGPPDKEGEANARLIAAAPELYRQLEIWVSTVVNDALLMCDPDLAREVDASRALLAKARGEQ